MMAAESRLVAVSGAVGIAVATSAQPIQLHRIFLTPSGANATVKIREGVNNSGSVVFFGRAPSAYGTKELCVNHKFTRGFHVTVIGANAQAYVNIS